MKQRTRNKGNLICYTVIISVTMQIRDCSFQAPGTRWCGRILEMVINVKTLFDMEI